jgi:hypothetical protein
MTGHLTDDQLETLARSGASDNERTHLDSCARCLDRLVELERLHRSIQAIPPRIEPPLDLWPAIRAHIQTKVEGQKADRPSTAVNSFSSWTQRWNRVQLTGLAAALLLLTSASIAGFVLGRRSGRTVVSATLNDTSVVVSVPAPEAEATAITPFDSGTRMARTASSGMSAAMEDDTDIHAEQELLADLEMRRSSLRPETSSEIDSSLTVINEAIAELRAASARDPKNATLRQLLAASRERKVELLRQTENAS